MFPKLISNLSFVPGLGPQLTFYVRRLRKESVTRKLSVMAGLSLALFQLMAIVSPATASNRGSTNDIIYGGFSSQSQFMSIYDHGLSGHQSASEIQGIFNYFGITRTDLVNTKTASISTSDHNWWSLGRTPHFAQDHPYQIGGTTYYLRPLYLWDRSGTTSTYQVLVGSVPRGGGFAIMYYCGNLVFHGVPTIIKPPPPPIKPPIKPPPPPPPPVVPTNPNIHISKQATYQKNGTDANNTEAQAGDVINYSLLVKNTGDGNQNNYQIAESISDVLEYARVIDTGGGTVQFGTISWPAVTIHPGQLIVRKFQIKVKNPIPTTPSPPGDPASFDLRMDNVYGRQITITLPPPPPKRVELAEKKLPQTGGGLNAMLVFAFVGLCVYFYSRNRQLITEVNILRAEQTHGGGHND